MQRSSKERHCKCWVFQYYSYIPEKGRESGSETRAELGFEPRICSLTFVTNIHSHILKIWTWAWSSIRKKLIYYLAVLCSLTCAFENPGYIKIIKSSERMLMMLGRQAALCPSMQGADVFAVWVLQMVSPKETRMCVCVFPHFLTSHPLKTRFQPCSQPTIVWSRGACLFHPEGNP